MWLRRNENLSMNRRTVMFIFGTRPEAIKLASLVNKFSNHTKVFKTLVVDTDQNRQMLDRVLELFAITPDYDLDIMVPDQTLAQVTATSETFLCAIKFLSV